MGYWIVNGRKLTDEEHAEHERQAEREKQGAREEARRLTQELGQAYAALKEHLRRNPGTSRQITDDRMMDQEIYQTLRQNLERADEAPRCAKIKADGTECGCPRMRNNLFCYAHDQMQEARAKKLVLPALEDANGIQMAVMLVQRALIDDEITEKKAGLLLYSLQIAAANVNKTTFGEAADEDMVTETEEEEVALERLELERRKTLPRTNTDGTDGARVEAQDLTANGRMLPQSAGDGAVRSSEPYANLCPSTREARVDGAALG